jgi:hypothetical protein
MSRNYARKSLQRDDKAAICSRFEEFADRKLS